MRVATFRITIAMAEMKFAAYTTNNNKVDRLHHRDGTIDELHVLYLVGSTRDTFFYRIRFFTL